MFWSNSSGYIPIDNVIAAVIEKGSLDDLLGMRYRFGDERVVRVLLENYSLDESKYKRISDVLGV